MFSFLRAFVLRFFLPHRNFSRVFLCLLLNLALKDYNLLITACFCLAMVQCSNQQSRQEAWAGLDWRKGTSYLCTCHQYPKLFVCYRVSAFIYKKSEPKKLSFWEINMSNCSIGFTWSMINEWEQSGIPVLRWELTSASPTRSRPQAGKPKVTRAAGLKEQPNHMQSCIGLGE